jgi:hypothetical protein
VNKPTTILPSNSSVRDEVVRVVDKGDKTQLEVALDVFEEVVDKLEVVPIVVRVVDKGDKAPSEVVLDAYEEVGDDNEDEDDDEEEEESSCEKEEEDDNDNDDSEVGERTSDSRSNGGEMLTDSENDSIESSDSVDEASGSDVALNAASVAFGSSDEGLSNSSNVLIDPDLDVESR